MGGDGPETRRCPASTCSARSRPTHSVAGRDEQRPAAPAGEPSSPPSAAAGPCDPRAERDEAGGGRGGVRVRLGAAQLPRGRLQPTTSRRSPTRSAGFRRARPAPAWRDARRWLAEMSAMEAAACYVDTFDLRRRRTPAPHLLPPRGHPRAGHGPDRPRRRLPGRPASASPRASCPTSSPPCSSWPPCTPAGAAVLGEHRAALEALASDLEKASEPVRRGGGRRDRRSRCPVAGRPRHASPATGPRGRPPSGSASSPSPHPRRHRPGVTVDE